MEPLLVSSRICVYLHVKIIYVCANHTLLCLEKVSAFKKRIEEKNGSAVLLFQSIDPFFVAIDVLQEPSA